MIGLLLAGCWCVTGLAMDSVLQLRKNDVPQKFKAVLGAYRNVERLLHCEDSDTKNCARYLINKLLPYAHQADEKEQSEEFDEWHTESFFTIHQQIKDLAQKSLQK